MTEEFKTILASLQSINGVAIDCHAMLGAKLRDRLTKIEAIGMVGDHVVAIHPAETRSYSVNKLFIGSDCMVHISKMSVGVSTNGNFASFVTDITPIKFK